MQRIILRIHYWSLVLEQLITRETFKNTYLTIIVSTYTYRKQTVYINIWRNEWHNGLEYHNSVELECLMSETSFSKSFLSWQCKNSKLVTFSRYNFSKTVSLLKYDFSKTVALPSYNFNKTVTLSKITLATL